MKKIVTLLALIVCNCSFIHAQDYIWAKSLPGPADESLEISKCIVTDAAGNVYITGHINHLSVDFDPGPATVTFQPASLRNIFFAKYDANGNYVWAKVLDNTNGYGYSNSIALDASGNVYIAGYHGGSTDFDPGAGTASVTSTSAAAFFAKYDNSGNYIWANVMNGDISEANAISTDASGHVYVTGYLSGTVDFDPGMNTATLTTGPAMSRDVFLAKYDANGNYIWAKRAGGSSYDDAGNAIKADASGNVYVTGYFNDVADFDPGPGTATLSAPITGSTRYTDAFFAKYDVNGNYVWANAISSVNKHDVGTAIAVDAANNVYVGGNFRGTADFDPGVGTATISGKALLDNNLFIAKYDASGNYLWAKSTEEQPGSNTAKTECTSLVLDALNNVYITGGFEGHLVDFDPGPGTVLLSSPRNSLNVQLGTDIFFAKYDQNGNYSWAKAISRINPGNSTYDNQGNSIAVSTAGHVHITGFFETTYNVSPQLLMDFDPGPGTATLSTLQSQSADIFIAKYNSCPAPTITASSGTICPGETYSITISGATTYSLNGTAAGSYTVSPSSTTVYSVTGTSQACSSAIPVTATVLVKAAPNVTVSSGAICAGKVYTIAVGGAATYSINGSGVSNFTVSPLANTHYSVTGTGANGCMSGTAAVAEVTVYALPQLSAGSGSICAGGVYSIAVSGAATYSVNGNSAGNFTFSPSTTTNYSITGTDLNGCTSANAAVATITVHALPVVSANSGGLCTGSIYTLNPGGAASYSINGIAATSFTVNPASNAQYSITGLSSAGCVSGNTAVAAVTVYSLPSISASGGSLCAGQSYVISASGASSYLVNGTPVSSLAFNPASTTTYSLTGKSVEGCASSNTVVVTLTVQALPVVTVNSPSVCAGKPVVLTANGADQYSWNNGQPGASLSVSPALTTTYTVTGTNTTGCSKVVTAIVTVNSASITVSSSPTICVNETAILIASGANTYTWSTSTNGASISVNPAVTTTYSVEGTDSNGCNGSSVVTLQVEECTGIAELTDLNTGLSMYPNPAAEVVNVKINAVQTTPVFVYDVCGKEVITNQTENGTVQLNVSYLAKGVYFIKVGTSTQKFVKE